MQKIDKIKQELILIKVEKSFRIKNVISVGPFLIKSKAIGLEKSSKLFGKNFFN